ncbi:DUF6221 family protein [Streptomyces sp. NBC_01565]|uniref:DUF6221 family protein n=1 Tax=Streptomyces sp. NBC_01565 TaxID=2975881 RepID=UPI00224F8BEC|nr:DUF6221 family protein [Streptomyces sp. NBC_01565]MCX4543759.1 DUF6221 family protein [Streptomyces sp. NBC_01565]
MTEALINFLRDRLADDERAAQLMEKFYPSPWELSDRGWMARVVADGPAFREVIQLEDGPWKPTGEDVLWLGDIIDHVSRHDPARVLAEVDAKRRIVALHSDSTGHSCSITDKTGYELNYADVAGDEACTTLRLLALPYADHPDYRQEWKP